MEFETWWLVLLPAFFAAGWFAARWDLRQTIRAARQLPATYFQGLNHLLHDENDEAVDALINVVKLDPDTPELHFALGTLFRRRGETERAIRVHENLLSRGDLSSSQRQQALLESGLDYVKAGLLDRAEKALSQLESTPLAVKAEEQRLLIAQSVRDWPLAIALCQTLKADGHAESARHELQYRCAQIDDALNVSPPNLTLIGDYLSQDLIKANGHPWVLLLRARFHLFQQDTALAIEILRSLFEQYPDYSSLAAGLWMTAHRPNDSAVGLEQLKVWFERSPSDDLMISIANETLEIFGRTAASDWLTDRLRSRVSLAGLNVLARINAGAPVLPINVDLLSIQLAGVTVKGGRYVCHHCGFQAKNYYWHCPGCNQWESYQPSTQAI